MFRLKGVGGYWEVTFRPDEEMKRTVSQRDAEEDLLPPPVLESDYDDAKLVYADPPWGYSRTAG